LSLLSVDGLMAHHTPYTAIWLRARRHSLKRRRGHFAPQPHHKTVALQDGTKPWERRRSLLVIPSAGELARMRWCQKRFCAPWSRYLSPPAVGESLPTTVSPPQPIPREPSISWWGRP